MRKAGTNLLTNATCAGLFAGVGITLSNAGLLSPEADMLIAGLFAWSFPMIIVALRLGSELLSPAHFHAVFCGGQTCLCLALGGLVRILAGSPMTSQGWILGGLLLPPTVAVVVIMQKALFTTEELAAFSSKRQAGPAALQIGRDDQEVVPQQRAAL